MYYYRVHVHLIAQAIKRETGSSTSVKAGSQYEGRLDSPGADMSTNIRTPGSTLMLVAGASSFTRRRVRSLRPQAGMDGLGGPKN